MLSPSTLPTADARTMISPRASPVPSFSSGVGVFLRFQPQAFSLVFRENRVNFVREDALRGQFLALRPLFDIESGLTFLRTVDNAGGAESGGSHVLHASAVRSLTTGTREDGAFFPQDQSPIANRSFLLYQRWLKSEFPLLTASLFAFSSHFVSLSIRRCFLSPSIHALVCQP